MPTRMDPRTRSAIDAYGPVAKEYRDQVRLRRPVADVARRLQPAGVCRWPDGRDALPDLVVRAVGAPRVGGGTGRILRVGVVAGGVGTTTVVLALVVSAEHRLGPVTRTLEARAIARVEPVVGG